MMPTAPSTEHIDRVAAVHALPFDSLFPCLQHITAQILLSTAPCRAASTTSHAFNAVGFPVRVEAAISRPSSRASCLADSDGSKPGENFPSILPLGAESCLQTRSSPLSHAPSPCHPCQPFSVGQDLIVLSQPIASAVAQHPPSRILHRHSRLGMRLASVAGNTNSLAFPVDASSLNHHQG